LLFKGENTTALVVLSEIIRFSEALPCILRGVINLSLKSWRAKMKRITLLLLSTTFLAVSGNIFAADVPSNSYYVLGGLGQTTGSSDQSNLDSALTSVGGRGFSSTLSKPTVYKLQLGYQANQYFAVEGGFIGSNNENYTASGGNLAGPLSASASVKGWNLVGVGILPVANQFSLLGKLGVASIKESATLTGPGGTFTGSGSKFDVTYGVGAMFDFTKSIFARFDVDSYSVGNSTSSARSTVWMVDVGFRF
jgi:OOP family OmpA-OmpF porin